MKINKHKIFACTCVQYYIWAQDGDKACCQVPNSTSQSIKATNISRMFSKQLDIEHVSP